MKKVGTGSPRSPIPESTQFALLFGALFLAVIAMVIGFELDPARHPNPILPGFEDQQLSHRQIMLGLMVSCGIGTIGVLSWGFIRRWRWAHGRPTRLLIKVVLIVAVFASGFSYFYLRRGVMENHYTHRYDSFHYLMHPRYFQELDYADLYVCTIEAVPRDVIPDDWRVRDLRTYGMTSVGALRAEALCPRENFTPERWARWVADLKVFTDTPGGPGVLERAIRDRGYNGTPTHSALSGWLADRIPLTIATHNMVPLLDVAMICAMLYAATVAFGWKIGLLFALSVFAMAADRWGIIGGSWLRYAWYVALTLGIVALRRGLYAWSGALLALSATLNVFPVLFAAGVVLRGSVTCWQERRLVPRYRNFVLAGVVTGLVALAIGLLPARHADNYTGWVANMSQHNTERFQGVGIGLKFPFIYRGGNTLETDRAYESERRALFHQNRKAYYPLAIVLVLLAGAFALRTRDDVEAATILGFTLFFCFLGTVGYYFACASLLVLGLHRRARTPGGTTFLALWFLCSLLAHWALYETSYYRFTYNTVISLTWTVWLTGLLFWLAAEEKLLARAGRLLLAPAGEHSSD